MKQFLQYLCISLLFVGSLLGAQTPAEKLAQTVDAALEVVYGDCCIEQSVAEKQAQVREIIESNFDITVLIRRAIGRNWKLMGADEQEQVLELVKQLVVRAYVQRIEGMERPEVIFEDTIEVSSKRIEIPSVVVLDGQPIRVLYRMGLMGSGWQLFDIVAEDISVVSNFRQQFDDHFRKGTGAELINRLSELLEGDDLNEKFQL